MMRSQLVHAASCADVWRGAAKPLPPTTTGRCEGVLLMASSNVTARLEAFARRTGGESAVDSGRAVWRWRIWSSEGDIEGLRRSAGSDAEGLSCCRWSRRRKCAGLTDARASRSTEFGRLSM